jgi:hypothetical protein
MAIFHNYKLFLNVGCPTGKTGYAGARDINLLNADLNPICKSHLTEFLCMGI